MTQTVPSETPSPPLARAAFDPARRANPYPAYSMLREAGRILPLGPGTWAVTRMNDIEQFLVNPVWGHGYDDKISPFRPGVGRDIVPGSFLGMDPPDHTRLRRLVSKAFTARMVQRMRERTQQIADDLLDVALEANEVDFVEAFAGTLPRTVICETVGVPPEDYAIFKDWSTKIVRGVDPDAMLTAQELNDRYTAETAFEEYFEHLVDERRGRHRGDLLSDLVEVEDAGDSLTQHELLEIGVMLMIAGHETTMNGMSNTLLALHRHPDQLQRLHENPDLTMSTVEEGLRFDPPVQFTSRVALAESEVLGVTYHRGQGVALLIGSANRDPEIYDEPDRFDIARYHGPNPASRHLTFSMGPHHCLGAQLSRMEIEVSLRTLLERAPRMQLLDLDPEFRPTLTFHGPAVLPVRLRP